MSDQQPPVDAEFEEVSEQRRADRRTSDRRSTRVKLDPLFATTLVNQVTPPEAPAPEAYVELKPRLRKGIVLNVKA
jgi:hypothetical protein